MKNLTVGVNFSFTQRYLPSKRHSVERRREMTTCRDINFKVAETEEEFPVAMIVTDYSSIYYGAKSYEEIAKKVQSSDVQHNYALYDEETRYYNGKFYNPRRISYGAAISDMFAPIDDAIQGIRNMGNTFTRYMGKPDVPFSDDKSIIIGDDSEGCVEAMQEKADGYIFYDEKIWEECGEPMYMINTFGLGHNHGGTGFFIKNFYNSNISAKNYFRADQYEEAIAYADRVAEGRGDTNDVGRFRDKKYIKVLHPEFLSRKPEVDHADGGDPFMEGIEKAISGSESVAEAGIIAMAMTMAEIASMS